MNHLKGILSVFCILLFLNGATAQRNVVLIVADDLGYDYLGFDPGYGDTVAVPVLRKLLTKGVLFSQLTANPYCSATRATYFTGRYAFRTGVGGVVGGTGGSGSLDTSEFALPELIKSVNSAVARGHIGKWHLNGAMPPSNLQLPQKFGIQHFEGPFIGQLNSYTSWIKYTNGVQSTVTNYATTENIDNAVKWLKTQKNAPKFLWLAFNAPHTPFHLPPLNLHTYKSLPGTPIDIRRNPKSYFKAMVQAMDTELGRLIDSLKAFGYYDSTDFIFVGDNGNATPVSQIADTAHTKGTIYEYGVHIPLFVAGPAVVNPGRISNALVNSVDLYATIADLLGLKNWQGEQPANKPLDAKSLLPILKNTQTSVRNWAFTELIQQTPDSTDGKAMRNDRYKLLRFDKGWEEFYDLQTDANEQKNLLKQALNADQSANYQFLCNEMNKLLNVTGNCTKLAVGSAVKNGNQIAFPNPFGDFIEVKSGNPNSPICVYNAAGQIAYTGFSGKIDTRNWPAGMYILKTGAQATCKLLKYLP